VTAIDPGSGGHLGLLTDLYELRMAQTCLREGMLAPATFSLYIRPTERRPWMVAAGIDRALEVVERFGYGETELDELRRLGLGEDLVGWLRNHEPEGEIWAVPDGTILLAEEPILEVTAPLPYAMLLETAIMNVVQFTALIATKAARCAGVAGGRPLADFGLRRAHGLEAGCEAARAAYMGGVGPGGPPGGPRGGRGAPGRGRAGPQAGAPGGGGGGGPARRGAAGGGGALAPPPPPRAAVRDPRLGDDGALLRAGP
jgi:hypothetical protein